MRRRALSRPVAGVLVVVFGLPVSAACNRSESVDLSFRPAKGASVSYSVRVKSRVVTELSGPPDIADADVRLRADQQLVGRDRAGRMDLAITMGREGQHPRTFDVRLDPVKGVAAVTSVAGLPVEALGELGPDRLVLLANGLLPGRSLRPGEEWHITRRLDLPEGHEHLRGVGRLLGLRVKGAVSLARVEATTRLPVRRELRTPQGRVLVRGTETTRATVDYRVADGTVHAARALTTGMFHLVVSPPGGSDIAPLPGTLRVRLESTTRRVGKS